MTQGHPKTKKKYQCSLCGKKDYLTEVMVGDKWVKGCSKCYLNSL